MNQTLETYLRHYINHAQSNWVELLPVAQLAINDHRSDSTKVSPFFANFGKHANINMEARPSPNADLAIAQDERLRDIHQLVKRNLLDTSNRMTKRNVPEEESGTTRKLRKRKMAP